MGQNNNWNMNPAVNPVGFANNNNNQQFMPPYGSFPHYEIIQVSGENGVDAFQMGPNSSVLLLDKTAPIIWLVQTDGAGYKVKTPYDINLHQAVPPVDINDLAARLATLEEIIHDWQSNAKPAKQSKKSRTNAIEQPADSAD